MDIDNILYIQTCGYPMNSSNFSSSEGVIRYSEPSTEENGLNSRLGKAKSFSEPANRW